MRTPHPDTSLSLLGKRKNGRPPKRSREIEQRLLKAISEGAPYALACGAAGISTDTFVSWRRADPAFQAEIDRVEAECALRRLRKIEKHGDENFAACCWLLERRHPEMFGRPEIQLNLISQSNTVENSLTINITAEEYAAIEAQNEPVRRRVEEMFERYRPGLGNGDTGSREIDASPVSEPEREPPVISHRDTDERNPAFWRRLVTSNPESLVAKDTAVFAVRTLLLRTLGYKAHRAQIDFAEDPVTVEDLFDQLERLCGGASGWQLAQNLGGY
jgi:hypothetical protein